jgi:hypothetical protein
MDERWVEIPEFPDYLVSDHGSVWSSRRRILMRLSVNQLGIEKVTFNVQNEVCTRSVAVLVAESFLEAPRSPSEVPIHLDGHQTHNHYLNLAWRPRWFAWRYTHQFNAPIPPEFQIPVWNLYTEIEYPSTMLAGIADGVLWDQVYRSILSGRQVYPTGHIYRFA